MVATLVFVIIQCIVVVKVPIESDVTAITIAITVCGGNNTFHSAVHALTSYLFYRVARLHIIILTDRLEFARGFFAVQWPDVNITVIDVLAVLPAACCPYLNLFKRCATARLFLSLLLPLYVDAVLYIDVNTFAFYDYRRVWAQFQLFDGEQAMALAFDGDSRSYYEDYVDDAFQWYRPFGLNAAVMLINVTRLRQWPGDWINTIITIAMTHMRIPEFKLVDQDILNIFFVQYSSLLYVMPLGYNYQVYGDGRPQYANGLTILHVEGGTAALYVLFSRIRTGEKRLDLGLIAIELSRMRSNDAQIS